MDDKTALDLAREWNRCSLGPKGHARSVALQVRLKAIPANAAERIKELERAQEHRQEVKEATTGLRREELEEMIAQWKQEAGDAREMLAAAEEDRDRLRGKLAAIRETLELASLAIPESDGRVHLPGAPCLPVVTGEQEHKEQWLRDHGIHDRFMYWEKSTRAHRSSNLDRAIHEYAKAVIAAALASGAGKAEGEVIALAHRVACILTPKFLGHVRRRWDEAEGTSKAAILFKFREALERM